MSERDVLDNGGVEDEPVEAITAEMIRVLVGKLPEKLRPLAKVYAPVLIAMTAQQVEAFVAGARNDPVEEYKKLYHALPTEQLVTAGDTLKEYWQSLNVENANVALEQKKAIDDLLVVGLLMVKAAVV